MELFFREAALEITMGGLEGKSRDTGRAVWTRTHMGGVSMMHVSLCMADNRVNLMDSVCGKNKELLGHVS